MATKLTRLTQKIEIKRGREFYHLQFSLQTASPETFGCTLIRMDPSAVGGPGTPMIQVTKLGKYYAAWLVRAEIY